MTRSLPALSAPTKQLAAIVGVVGGVVLAVLKVVVGVLTNSLSILAEALDAILDLVASGLTFVVVRVADLPPDDDHPYGHARAENLGTLAQAVLLTVTASVILWNALDRIFFSPVMTTITVWSFAVIVGSLVINAVRVLLLRRAARDHASDTLAANAANFATDMLSSLVVLATLILITLAPVLALPAWLTVRLDAIAAALVALFGLSVAWRLGNTAILALMDNIPPDLNRTLAAQVERIPAVVPDSTQIRTRFVGRQPYVDVTVGMPRGHTLEEAHQLTDTIEDTIRAELAAASVLVHVEPTRPPAEPHATAVYSVAHELGLRVHNLDLYQLSDELLVKVDLELPGSLPLQQAHTESERLEKAIRNELPGHARVLVHLEPRRDEVQPAVRYTPLSEKVGAVIQSLPGCDSILDVETLLTDRGAVVTIKCRFPGTTPLTTVHNRMATLEHDLRRLLPDVVTIQIDPEISD